MYWKLPTSALVQFPGFLTETMTAHPSHHPTYQNKAILRLVDMSQQSALTLACMTTSNSYAGIRLFSTRQSSRYILLSTLSALVYSFGPATWILFCHSCWKSVHYHVCMGNKIHCLLFLNLQSCTAQVYNIFTRWMLEFADVSVRIVFMSRLTTVYIFLQLAWLKIFQLELVALIT